MASLGPGPLSAHLNQMKRQLGSGQHPLPRLPLPEIMTWHQDLYPHCSQGPAVGQCPTAERRMPAFHTANGSRPTPAPGVTNGHWLPLHFDPFGLFLSTQSHYALDAALFFSLNNILLILHLSSELKYTI